MGEYYNWVNVDRKEYISPGDFDYGAKIQESLCRGKENELLCALRDLLSKEWVGDHVFWMGDETPIPRDPDNELLRILYGDTVRYGYPGDGFGAVCETYKNVSGLFAAAEEIVREEIGYCLQDIQEGIPISRNEYGVDFEKPFEGLFKRRGREFRYTLNHTKRICYSSDKTRILYQDGSESDFADPLPILLAYGREIDTGIWLGDVIGVSDEMPEQYELLEKIYLDW